MGQKRNFLLRIAGILVILFSVTVISNMKVTVFAANSEIASIKNKTVTSSDIMKIKLQLKVKSLFIKNCTLDDSMVTKLSKINHLKNIYITDCDGFTTLAPFSKSKKLEMLTCESSNKDKLVKWDGNTMFPETFAYLKELELRGIEFTSGGQFLANFSNIRGLEILRCKGIDDVSFLRKMPNLMNITSDSIDFSGNNTEILAECTQLYGISLENSHIETLDWIEGFTNLSALKITNGSIHDITSLASLKDDLQILSLADNQIESVEVLMGFSHLRQLNLSKNQITDISSLKECTDLYSVELSNNKIKDISPLSDSYQMIFFAADYNQIKTLEGLEYHSKLSTISLRGNQIQDLKPIESIIKSVGYIDFGENKLSDISVLAKTEECDELFLDHNKIESIDSLADIHYSILALHDNPIKSYSNFKEWENDARYLFLSYPKQETAQDFAQDLEKYKYSDKVYITDTPEENKKTIRDVFYRQENKCFQSEDGMSKILRERIDSCIARMF